MTGSALKNLKMFGNLCGDEAIRNVILATTMWSPLEDHIVGSKGEKELRHEKELCDKYWKAMIGRGARIARFLRTYDSAWTIVDLISVINPPNPLLLQEEMVDLKKEIWETHAAITLYDMLQKELANQRDAVKKLQKEAEMQDNAQSVRELNLQREEIEMTLRATSAQIRELKIPIGRQFLSLFSVKKTRAVSYPSLRYVVFLNCFSESFTHLGMSLYGWGNASMSVFACEVLAYYIGSLYGMKCACENDTRSFQRVSSDP
jgi:hypothetical protein